MPARPPRRRSSATPQAVGKWKSAAVPPGPRRVYRLRITLLETEPAVWRQVEVPADLRLDALHRVIQTAMGWDNAHLHHFIIGAREALFCPGAEIERERFSPFGGSQPERIAEEKVGIEQVLSQPGEAFGYEYDFGDSWEHAIELEAIAPGPADFAGPICLAGERAGPPEDCGGVWGFAEILKLLVQQPEEDDEDDASRREWLGDFDPAAFSVAEVNRRLEARAQRRIPRA